MNKFESKLKLAFLLRHCPVIYIEHKENPPYSCGRYYAITENELVHITFEIASCLDLLGNIVDVFNGKATKAEKCLETKRTETTIRNLSEFLYDRWDVIKFYSLDNERIF